jgi:predicted negative regulator of RcsB-dependent stress response
MTRHPTARRVHREDSSPDDAFIAGVLETSAWARQHSRLLIIGGIIAAVVVIGLVLFVKNRADRRAEAELQLSQARAVALSGNSQLAVRELEQFLLRFDGTPAAREARLLLGGAYIQAGQPQQAIEATQPVVRNLNTDMGVNAAMLQAAAYEQAGNTDEAERLYMRVGEDAGYLFQRQTGLENAARLRLQNDDFAGAAALYERLVEITPETAGERQIFEMRAGEARTLAATAGATSAGR